MNLKAVKTLFILVFFGLLLTLVYKLGYPLLVSSFSLPPGSGESTTEPFNQYSSTVKRSTDSYYVQYKNVIGHAENTAPGRETYYNADITFEVASQTTANRLNEDSARVVYLIRDTMSTFRREDMEKRGRQVLFKKPY